MIQLSRPYSLLSTLALFSAAILLAGCGGALNIPDSVASTQVQGPPMSGKVLGGHAPIVGAHIYLAQPGTKGIGSAATSILGNNGATSANGYTLTANTADPNVPLGSQYVTTDSTGSFSLTNAYKCTVGQPVFIYAYGGTPSTTAIGTSATYSITQIVVSNVSNSNHTATYTITVSQTEQLYPGETVTIGGLTGLFTAINGAQTVIGDSTLTPTTFSFTGTDHSGVGNNIAAGTYNTSNFGTAGTVSATPAANNSIAELATLGNCPAAGNFYSGTTALTYVYLNEVSTIAAAYTFQPFTSAANNTAWDIGSSGTTQGLLGIENAATTAGELYNIQGGGQISPTFDGEGHTANTLTVNSNGAIPQATIDTLANIIAACVDSASTVSANGTTTPSSQCSTLFSNATDNGLTGGTAPIGTAPIDTATAAINIARYPAGNHASTSGVNTSFVSNLFNLPTGDVPYAPYLTTAPNDFTLAIIYPYSASTISVPGLKSDGSLERAESVAVDSTSQIWITAQGNGSSTASTVLWSPFGVYENLGAPDSRGYIFGYVSIDGADNAWTGNATSTTGITEYNKSGTYLGTWGSGYTDAYTVIATDTGTSGSTSGAYFVAENTNTSGNYELFEYGPLGTTVSGSPFSISPSVITAGVNVAHGALDASGDLWLTTEANPSGGGGCNGGCQIARVSSTGAPAFTPITTPEQPEFPSIDHSGNAWIAVQAATSEIYVVPPSGANPTVLTSTSTGAELTSTFGSAVDGNGNVWLANGCGNYHQCGSTAAGVNTIIELSSVSPYLAISPRTNYVPETEYSGTPTTMTPMLYDPLNLAIDPSGNIWVTNYIGNSLVEVVGAAAPVVTPLSVAAATNKLGATP